MAAVAPQPVVVASPAGNPTAECPIYLAANSGVVSSTPCLDWQPAPAGPGGAARVQLNTFQAVRAFLPRCKISRTPADLAAANAINVLVVRLTDAGWSRILTELQAAQVFATTANSIDELQGFLKEATIPTPANLDVVAGDWRNAEAFAIPGGAGAGAAAARALLAPLRFLSLLAVTAVEEPAAPLPLGLLSIIVGALGPCLTQAARRVETSTVQLTAATLRLHLAATASTDALMAVKVASFFKAKQLPYQLRSVGVTEGELREELEDGIEYKRSDQGRLAIEEKRIHLLAAGCATSPASPPHACPARARTTRTARTQRAYRAESSAQGRGQGGTAHTLGGPSLPVAPRLGACLPSVPSRKRVSARLPRLGRGLWPSSRTAARPRAPPTLTHTGRALAPSVGGPPVRLPSIGPMRPGALARAPGLVSRLGLRATRALRIPMRAPRALRSPPCVHHVHYASHACAACTTHSLRAPRALRVSHRAPALQTA